MPVFANIAAYKFAPLRDVEALQSELRALDFGSVQKGSDLTIDTSNEAGSLVIAID
jgi:hypothetical protein